MFGLRTTDFPHHSVDYLLFVVLDETNSIESTIRALRINPRFLLTKKKKKPWRVSPVEEEAWF